ncbi:hypothetical protein AB6N24_21045 [Cellulomonas sp. 179-A 4D5 NHS]|uniref:hypothetical protein n=1 Tax=Cellulomonas sp. 179-A 4D5 NHS TaxID=3142378 RepID=UPI00399F578F
MSELGDRRAVRIPLEVAGNGFFDLGAVMAAVGPHPQLRWVLRDAWLVGDLRTVWAEGAASVEERSELGPGIALDWDTMTRLAATCDQVIDGYFTGYDDAGTPQLELAAVDSGWWKVWARDPRTLLRVRESFPLVTDDHPEPDPEPAPNHP